MSTNPLPKLSPSARKPARRGRFWRWAASFLLFSLLIVFTAILVLLKTEFGKRQLRAVVLHYAAESFSEGGFSFDELQGDPLGRFTLTNVVIQDSRGAPMATAARVEAGLDLWALLQNEARIQDVRAEDVHIRVQYDETAIHYPIPKSAPPDPNATPWTIIVESFTTEGASFEYAPVGGPPVYSLRAVSLRAGVHMDEQRIKLFLYEGAALSDGFYAGAHLRGEVTYLADELRTDWFELGIGASRIYLHGALRDFADIKFDFTIDPSFVTAADLRRLIPDLPILANLRLSGSLRGGFGDLAAEAYLEALGGGAARLRYVMNLYDPLVTWGLQASTEGLDLADWFGGEFPHTGLDTELGAIGTGFGDGDVERFTLAARGPVSGYPSTRISATGSYRRGVLRLDDLSATTERGYALARALYATETGQGGIAASLDLDELAALPLPLAGVGGALAGDVTLLSHGENASAEFALRARGARYDAYRVGQASARGKLRLEKDRVLGSVQLQGQAINLDGFLLSKAEATVTPDPDTPSERFDFQGGATLSTGESANASGTLSFDNEDVRVALSGGTVTLGHRETESGVEVLRYRLAPGAQIDALADRARWSGLSLRDEAGGGLSSEGAYLYAGGTLRATLSTKDLPIAPAVRIYAGDLPLQGALDLEASVEGPADAPRFRVSSALLHDASLADLRGLSVQLTDTSYDGKSFALKLDARANGAQLIYSSAQLPLDLYNAYLRDGPITGVLQLYELDLAALRPLLPASLASLDGALVFSAQSEPGSTGREPRISSSFNLRGAVLDEWKNVDISGRLNLSEDQVTAATSLVLEGQELFSANASIGLPWEELTGEVAAAKQPSDLLQDIPIDAQVVLDNISVQELLPRLPASYRESLPLSEGDLGLELRLGGTPRQPELSLHAEMNSFALRAKDEQGQDLLSLGNLNTSLDLLFEDNFLSLSGGFTGLEGIVSFEGSSDLDLTALLELAKQGASTEELTEQVPFDLAVTLEGFELTSIPWVGLGMDPALVDPVRQGVLGADLTLSGTLNKPAARFAAGIEDLSFWPQYTPPGVRPIDLVLTGSLDEQGLKTKLSGAEGGEGLLAGSASILLPLSTLLATEDLSTLPAPPISATFQTAPISAQRLFTFLGKRTSAEGDVWAMINLRGTAPLTWPAKLPGVDVNFYADKLRVDGVELVGKELPSGDRAPLFAFSLNDSVMTWNLDISSPADRSNLYSRGALPLDLTADSPISAETKLDGAILRARRFDLGLFSLVSPSIRSLKGRLSTNGNLTINGTLGAPTLGGEINIYEGQLAVDGLPTFKGMTIQASFRTDRVILEQINLSAGKGQAKLEGELTLVDSKPTDFILKMTADKFEVPYDGQSMALLNDFTSTLLGRFEENRLISRFSVERGKFQLPSIFSDPGKDLMSTGPLADVVFVSSREIEKSKAATLAAASSSKEPFMIELTLDLPGQFFIEGAPPEAKGIVSEMRLELGGKLRIDAGADLLSFVGELTLLEGSEVVIVDDRFIFSDKSGLAFIGTDLDPRLNLEATAEVMNEADAYNIKLAIGGTASQPEIKITSEPFLDEAQIATLLLTGRLEGNTDANATQQLLDGLSGTAQALGNSVLSIGVGALIQNTPLNDVKNILKLDVLRIDPQQGQLEAGRYFWKKCYAGFKYRWTGAETEGNFICRIGGGWGVNGRYSTPGNTQTAQPGNTAAGIDVIWSKDY